MVTGTASPSTKPSPPHKPVASSLPPLITTTSIPRRTKSQRSQTRRQSSYNKRLSAFSPDSKLSNPLESRPPSHVFPAFHSSLSYALVRDFAYSVEEPMHYGPLPHESGLTTPASDSRRFSDPAVSSWDPSERDWSAASSWSTDNMQSLGTREQLPAVSFIDRDGPPYSEDEDLRSPVVTSSRHRKHKSTSNLERGRSPGVAGSNGGRQYYTTSGVEEADEDGPGGTYEDYPQPSVQLLPQPRHRDSNFAKPLQRQATTIGHEDIPGSEEDETSEAEDENEDSRYSRDYSFTIASPDEEMHGKAVALFDFASEHQNELPLREGQIILVSYRHGQGWLVAQDPKTGESGLVPEGFVRLVRDIEGGLNGLGAVDIHEGETDTLEPAANDTDLANTPTTWNHEFPNQKATSSNGNEKHPPVQSTFSTSSKDLDPYPLPVRTEDTSGSPDRPQKHAEQIST